MFSIFNSISIEYICKEGTTTCAYGPLHHLGHQQHCHQYFVLLYQLKNGHDLYYVCRQAALSININIFCYWFGATTSLNIWVLYQYWCMIALDAFYTGILWDGSANNLGHIYKMESTLFHLFITQVTTKWSLQMSPFIWLIPIRNSNLWIICHPDSI